MSTLRGTLANLLRGELAKMGILIAVEYRVVSQAGDAVDLQIVRKASGLPDVARVYARPVAGHKATYTPGSLVLVVFVDGDPTRPFLAFGGVVGAPGTIPASAELDANGTIRIGRNASEVVVGSVDPPAPDPVARAPQLVTWATAVNVALAQIGTLLNAPGPVTGAPGTVAPYPVPSLSGDVASTLLSTQ